MHEDPTVRRPVPWRVEVPGAPPAPPGQPAAPRRARRRRRRLWLAAAIPLAILALLVGLDRVAAAYAANQIATKIQGIGFPVRPGVTVEGFPFLTQVISRHLDGVDISAPNFPAGPVTASVQVRATGIALNPGYRSGTIARVTGTGLVSFSSITTAVSAAGAPGLKVSRAGPHTVKLTANLQVLSASAIARVTKTGRHRFMIRIVSANGIPPSLLGPVRHFTVPLPELPSWLAVQTVSVTSQGVLLSVTGSDVPFGS
jgi:hypothetical protein